MKTNAKKMGLICGGPKVIDSGIKIDTAKSAAGATQRK
jgi:hypothetical protein